MARGTKDQDSGSDPATDKSRPADKATKLGAPPKLDGGPPTLSAWFEEAWHGWMKPVGGIVLFLGAYLAYTGGLVQEEAAGRIVLALIIGGAVFMGIEPVLERFTDSRRRYMAIGFAVVWAIVAAGPLFRVIFPGKVLGDATITKDASGAVVTMSNGDKGPYEVVISGHLRGSGEVDAPYDVELGGDGESTDHVSGELKRTYFNQRTSRRGTASVAVKQENTENVHRVSGARGPTIKLSGEVGSDMLEDGLHIAFRHAGPAWYFFFLVGLVLFVGAVVIDYRMLAPKAERTHLSAATGFTMVFGLYYAYYPEGATPHNLVRPAIAGLLAAGFGSIVAWGISAMVNSFKPRPKKLAGMKGKFAEEEE